MKRGDFLNIWGPFFGKAVLVILSGFSLGVMFGGLDSVEDLITIMGACLIFIFVGAAGLLVLMIFNELYEVGFFNKRKGLRK